MSRRTRDTEDAANQPGIGTRLLLGWLATGALMGAVNHISRLKGPVDGLLGPGPAPFPIALAVMASVVAITRAFSTAPLTSRALTAPVALFWARFLVTAIGRQDLDFPGLDLIGLTVVWALALSSDERPWARFALPRRS